MVFAALKHLIFGKPDYKRQLLPTARSYDTMGADTVIEEDRRSESSESTLADTFSSPRVISDIIIGLADGLTVPFALTAGLSSLGTSKLVITGGLAELIAGAISMGLGGFLAAKSEKEHYEYAVMKERRMLKEDPGVARMAIHEFLCDYKVSPTTIDMFVNDIEKHAEETVQFVVQYARGVEEPAEGRMLTSALTIGLSYFIGGFVPLIPYFFTSTVETGLYISIGVMTVALFTFGCVKTWVSLGSECPRTKIVFDGFTMMLTGGLAAAAAWGLVRAIEATEK